MTVANVDHPVLDLLAAMTEESIEASTLDPKMLMRVRFAALVAMDAPPVSYLANLGAAQDLGMDIAELQSVLLAIAPIVGTPRVMSAASKIARAFGIAIAIAENELRDVEV